MGKWTKEWKTCGWGSATSMERLSKLWEKECFISQILWHSYSTQVWVWVGIVPVSQDLGDRRCPEALQICQQGICPGFPIIYCLVFMWLYCYRSNYKCFPQNLFSLQQQGRTHFNQRSNTDQWQQHKLGMGENFTERYWCTSVLLKAGPFNEPLWL